MGIMVRVPKPKQEQLVLPNRSHTGVAVVQPQQLPVNGHVNHQQGILSCTTMFRKTKPVQLLYFRQNLKQAIPPTLWVYRSTERNKPRPSKDDLRCFASSSDSATGFNGTRVMALTPTNEVASSHGAVLVLSSTSCSSWLRSSSKKGIAEIGAPSTASMCRVHPTRPHLNSIAVQ